MVQAGVAARAPGLSIPVEHQNGLGTVAELRAGAVVGVHAQRERFLVPGDRAGDVGDRQFHGTEAQRRGQHGRVKSLSRSHASSVVRARPAWNGQAARMYGRRQARPRSRSR